MRFVLIILALLATCHHKVGAQKLYLENSFFLDQDITDLVSWHGHIWASTQTGLHRLEKAHTERIAVPPAENDKITSLYNHSPFALICGTYKGNLVFISQDNNNYCNVTWELHDPRATSTFYISSITQDDGEMWVGSLEKGIYKVDPIDRSLQNFSLDFSDDTTGLNVYQVWNTEKGDVWANSQNGLFFITHVVSNTELSYTPSSRFRKTFSQMIGYHDDVLVCYPARSGKTKLRLLEFSNQRMDARVSKRFKLPDELESNGINAIQIIDEENLWVLGESLWNLKDDEWIAYELPETLNNFQFNKLIVQGNEIWVSDPRNGVFLLNFEEENKEKNLIEASNIPLDKPTELQNVFFKPGDSALIDYSYSALTALSTQMRNDSNVVIQVSGHTALDGDSLYLYNLSLGRARAVRYYLLSQGINPNRVVVKGFGATQLKNIDEPKAGVNRRVEILMKMR